MLVRVRAAHAAFGVILSIFALASATGTAQDFSKSDLAAARELRDRGLRSPLAYELVSSLTTEVGPRLAGTPGDRAAVEWSQRTFKKLGFANVRTMEVIVPRWARGTASARIMEPFPQELATVALGGSVGTQDNGVRAEVVEARNVDALARMDSARIDGKIVYLSAHMERTRDGSGYGKTVSNRTSGPSVAASKGALAVVIRSVGTSNNRLSHTGTTIYNIGSPRIPAVAISNPDADLLERQLATAARVVMEINVTARDLPQTRSANVIGEIPGTDKAEEVVLLAAHLDSWDLGTGALDDGAGIAIITAAAHMLKDIEPKPRRTIRVVHFANEEFGLSGSREYTEQVVSSGERHAMALEADVGAGPVYSLESRVAPDQLSLIKQMWSVLEPLAIERGANRASGGADIGALRAHGVPVISPRLDATLYFDHHHTANDTLDKVNPQHIAQAATAFAVAAYLASRAEQTWMQLPDGS